MIRINKININNIIRLQDKYIRVGAYQKQICKFRIRLLQVAEKDLKLWKSPLKLLFYKIANKIWIKQ